jgi:8-oxo-dGTP diphosphatase
MPNRDSVEIFLQPSPVAAGLPVEEFAPMDVSQAAVAPRRVVGAALVDDLQSPSRLLAARRTEPPALAGGWEFPGGKVDDGEDDLEALHRELLEELGVRVEVGEPVPGPLEGGRWPLGDAYAMGVWLARVTAGEPLPLEDHDQLRWLTRTSLYAVEWLPADLPIVRAIEARMARR